MGRVTFFWLIFLALVPSQASAGFAVMGIGTETCGQFAGQYKDDSKFIEAVTYSWAQGIMSGMNEVFILKNEATADLSALSTDEQERFIRTYCDQHPLGDYMDAVLHLYFSLKKDPPLKRAK